MSTVDVTEMNTGTTNKTLRAFVVESIQAYFASLNGEPPVSVHSIVLGEVEAALYEAVMKFTRGNQSRAAKLMGVSRGTLRTKLKQHFGTTHVGLDRYRD